MPAPDLDLLIDAARAAGDIAMRHWRNSPKVWEKPGEGPVTEADIEVNDMLAARLRAARRDYGWLSEETFDTGERLAREHVFLIDPIDGTSTFIAGEANFSHSLAIARNGVVTAAVVFMPAKDCLYAATADGPATCNDVPIHCAAATELTGANILTPKASLAPAHWNGAVPDFQRHFRSSIAYRLCLVAEGRFDAMLTLRQTWEWDIAAGALICERAGAPVTNRLDQPIRFNAKIPRSNGVVAAAAGIHQALVKSLKA